MDGVMNGFSLHIEPPSYFNADFTEDVMELELA